MQDPARRDLLVYWRPGGPLNLTCGCVLLHGDRVEYVTPRISREELYLAGGKPVRNLQLASPCDRLRPPAASRPAQTEADAARAKCTRLGDRLLLEPLHDVSIWQDERSSRFKVQHEYLPLEWDRQWMCVVFMHRRQRRCALLCILDVWCGELGSTGSGYN